MYDRRMSQTKIGIVLSSGGGRGVFGHTGFTLALDDLGLKISASSGSSAGAVVGGIIASGTTTKAWAEALKGVNKADYWTPRSSSRLFFDLSFNKGRGLKGISSTAAAIGFLSKHLTVSTFEECAHPFSTVAVNLGDGSKRRFDTGLLAPRIMASAAMPVFYEPVEIDGEYFTDGAIIDLAPADAICCRYKLDVLIVHHVAQRDYTTRELEGAFDQPWTLVNILHRLIYHRRPWYTTGQPRSIRPCPCGCRAVVVVIEPTLPELSWPVTAGATNIIASARTQALAQLEPLQETLYTEPRRLL